jgi:predicted ATP-grasp superfamily ATP-dependent carboligase
MRVLVADGDNRAALAIVRALGRAGHWVAVGAPGPQSLARSSKFCGQAVSYPNPAVDEAGFIAGLKRAVDDHRIDVVIPATDISTLLIARHRGEFSASCKIPFGDADVIACAADKVGLLKNAMRRGVPVPRTVFLEDRRSSSADLGFGYPVVVKPGRSRVRTSDGWLSCCVEYAANRRQLLQQLAARRDEEYPIALQERIQGPGMGVFLCFTEGRTVAQFAHRRVREKPPSGGVSVLSESVAVPPQALAYAETLLRDLQWEGVAMVEFKQDLRDGQLKLMEINGRFWGSLQLAIDAGVDFPNILLACLDGRPPATPPPYAEGVRSRWFWGHVDSVAVELLKRDANTGRDRLGALRDFLRLWGRNLYYENPRWGDLGPWLYETRMWWTGAR